MRRHIFLLFTAGALFFSACASDVEYSSELSQQYSYYQNSVDKLRSEMGVSAEEADDIFLILTDCGVDDELTYVFKNNDGTFAIWSSVKNYTVSLDNNKVSTVCLNNEQLYPEPEHRNILMDYDFTVEDVMNGFGDTVIGQCAYFYITEKEFDGITKEDIREFAEKRVDGTDYNWISIVCTNRKGICFPGSDPSYATYGKLDEDGSLTSSIGIWLRDKDGSYVYSEGEETTTPSDNSQAIFDFSSPDISFGDVDTGDLQLQYGDLLSVVFNDGIVVVKAKIQPNLTDKMTIEQNYFNVGDLIKNQGFNTCKELQYWAVADMESGDEVKVISFDLDKTTIDKVYSEKILENQLEDHIDNLFIHASLEK